MSGVAGDHARELGALVAARWSSIDATLAGLRAIDGWGRRRGDVRGVFAAAYVVVTTAVADALRRDTFEDPEWVRRVVIDFAERYREAVRATSDGDARIRCWGPALRRSRGGGIAAIVALLHGMIAHIHHDLAHSLCACAPIHPRRAADYEQIGAVICGSTSEIQQVILDAYAPDLRGLHGALHGADTWLTNTVVRAWRARARRIAERMSVSPSHAVTWSWRLGLESAALAVGLDVLTWPVRVKAIAGDGAQGPTLETSRTPSAHGGLKAWT